MKHRIVSETGSQRLLLIFAGWGMDDNVFAGISRAGYDVMVVWDYRSLGIDWECTARYTEICLVAWSLGVYAASQSTHAIDYKITRRIAVNGTLTPIDDMTGIPEKIFHGTLAGLSERSVGKFRRRMCATPAEFAHFSDRLPERGVDSLRDELQAVADSLILNVPSACRWDLAVIGRHDLIFPPFNQRRAWLKADVEIQMADCGHYTDFQKIVDENFIDKSTMAERFSHGMKTYTDNATVQAEAIDRLIAAGTSTGILRGLASRQCEILEIGSGSGMLSRRITAIAPAARLALWDLAAEKPAGLPSEVSFTRCDAEIQIQRIAPESLDFIFSSSTMQWFNSPERFLQSCYRALRAGGCALLTTFVHGNMHQISALTGNSLPLPHPDQLLHMASKIFEVVDSRHYTRDLDFESPLDVLRHLRLTGVNSLAADNNHAAALSIARHYPMMLDGLYHLTYHPMILILRKP